MTRALVVTGGNHGRIPSAMTRTSTPTDLRGGRCHRPPTAWPGTGGGPGASGVAADNQPGRRRRDRCDSNLRVTGAEAVDAPLDTFPLLRRNRLRRCIGIESGIGPTRVPSLATKPRFACPPWPQNPGSRALLGHKTPFDWDESLSQRPGKSVLYLCSTQCVLPASTSLLVTLQ